MRLLLLFLAAWPLSAAAQQDSLRFDRSWGGVVSVTDSGFGAGAFLRIPTGDGVVALVEAGAGGVSHPGDDLFAPAPWTTRRVHHAVQASLRAGIELRLFHRELVDVFRPFLLLGAGPVLVWEYPAFDDLDGNGSRSENEPGVDVLARLSEGSARAGIGALVAVGAHFGRAERRAQGVRLGYRWSRLPAGLSLLSREASPPTRLVASPEISVYLGRLF